MLTIYDKNGYFLKWSVMNYSGGEIRFQLDKKHIYKHHVPVSIEAKLYNSNDIMQLLMVTDALRRAGATEIDLVCPYFPYARQDRVCNPGEALSVKVMADLINSQGYKSVEIWDAHSDVTPALLDRCINIHQRTFTSSYPNRNVTVVAPDAGAAKKAFETANMLNVPLVIGGKYRSTLTGEITGTYINKCIHKGTVLIVDDICDGGTKKSAKGYIRVEYEDGKFVLYDNQSDQEEMGGLLEPVFADGELLRHETLETIRKRLQVG